MDNKDFGHILIVLNTFVMTRNIGLNMNGVKIIYNVLFTHSYSHAFKCVCR